VQIDTDFGMPEMVSRDDPRVSPLVKSLEKYRRVRDGQSALEELCRAHAIDPFFREVAEVTNMHFVVPAHEHYKLKVLLEQTCFSGLSDALIGSTENCLPPALNLEFKPRCGDRSLSKLPRSSKGRPPPPVVTRQWAEVHFDQRAEVVNQTMAFQSLWDDTAWQFYSVLTNLDVLYVVHVESYSRASVCAGGSTPISDATTFVRVLLWVLDHNQHMVMQWPPRSAERVTCVAERSYPPQLPSPAGQAALASQQQPRSGGAATAGAAAVCNTSDPARRTGHGAGRHCPSDPGPIGSKLPSYESLDCFRDHFIRGALENMCPRSVPRVPLQNLSSSTLNV
jgi:hypothetical protein